jgi:LAO/AO transport system kinase
VEAPGLGDDIQAIKAGILEIADILVINKADRPGVENTERALRTTLELAHPTKRVIHHHGQVMKVSDSPRPADSPSDKPIWIPPINKTIATEGKGIAELAESIAKHVAYLRQDGGWELRDRARLGSELQALLQEELMSRFLKKVQRNKYEEILEKVIQRTLAPYEAIKLLLNENLDEER